MPDDAWDPLPQVEVASLGKPYVAGGFLRLNKPALVKLIKVLGQRPGTGYRDLAVLLGLLAHARFSGKQYPGAEGAVPGTDAELAREIGVQASAFRRAVSELIDRQYLERLHPTASDGYRITRPVWEWLQAEEMPPVPELLDTSDPFGPPRTRRPRSATKADGAGN